MRSRRRESSPVRFRASFMAPRGKESTRPAFPNLLAQQTRPFDPKHPPAAFPSLPLIGGQVRQSEGIAQSQSHSVRSSSVDLNTSDENNEEVNTRLSSEALSEVKIGSLGDPPSPSENRGDSLTRVSWSSLELSCRYTIFVELLKQEPDERLIAIALGLNNQEFEDIQLAVTERKLHPATVNEIWDFGVATDGIGPSAMAPETLNMYLGYLVKASLYEDVTVEGLVAARKFLRQKGLDIVMSNTFKNQLRESSGQAKQDLRREQSKNPHGEVVQGLSSLEVRQTHKEKTPLSSGEKIQHASRENFQSLHRGDSQPSPSKDIQNESDASLLKRYPEVLNVARIPYSDLSASLRNHLSPKSYNDMLVLVDKHLADDGQSTESDEDSRPLRRGSEPRTPVQTSQYIKTTTFLPHYSDSSSNRPSKPRVSRGDITGNPFRHDTAIQASSSRRYSERQIPPSSMSLEINRETGRASVAGISRRQQSLKDSLIYGFPHHRLHHPPAFAAHLVCQGFPSKIRTVLLAHDPRTLNNTNFWLVYGNGPDQHLLRHNMGITGPRGTEYNPRITMLEESVLESHALHSLVSIHNQWIQAGVWRTAPKSSDALSQFERVTVLTLENIRAQNELAAEQEGARQLLRKSSEQNNSNDSTTVDTAMELDEEYDDNTTVAASPSREADRDEDDRRKERQSPERPPFSPISEFGGTLPDWLLDDDA